MSRYADPVRAAGALGRRQVGTLALAGLAAIAALAIPAAAHAGTRLQVTWTTSFQGAASPSVNLYADGMNQGFCGGPIPPPNSFSCQPRDGFHWEPSSPNANGYPQVITLIDDQTEKSRRLCYEVQHPSPTGHYDISVTVTDPDGATRTRLFGLEPNQTSELDCSPVVLSRPTLEVPPPPAWWRAGNRVVRKRGGKCDTKTEEIPADDPTTGRPAEPYHETTETCLRRGPSEHKNSFCFLSHSEGNPQGDEYAYGCNIYPAGPKPGWVCYRSKTKDPHETRDDRFWFKRSPRSQRHVRKLRSCLKRHRRR